jgi:ATP-dependent Clp protease ATP-binding subunit ClpC
LAKRLAERGVSFKLTPEAKDWLAEKGFEPTYGARPLRRAIQKYLEDPLSEEILRGQYAGDCELEIVPDPDADKLKFNFVEVDKDSKSKEEKVSQ